MADQPRTTEQDGKLTFRDDGTHPGEFCKAGVLVECPQCRDRATAAPSPAGESGFFARRLICEHCGWTKEIAVGVFGEENGYLRMGYSGNVEYRLPLWLRTNCLGHTLWAYNHEHLSRIREIVAADLRVSTMHCSPQGTSNASLYSRLPTWMLKPSHRDAVLKAIDSLLTK